MSAPEFSARWERRLHRASRSRSFLWKFAATVILAGAAVGYGLSWLNPSGPENFRARVLALSGLPIEEPEAKRPRASAPTVVLPEGVETEQPALAIAIFAQQLSDPQVPFVDVLLIMPRLAEAIPARHDEALRRALRQRFSETETALALNFLRAWGLRDRAALERLQTMAGASPPVPHANYALGRIELQQEHFSAALPYFLREGERREARSARYLAVVALLEGKDYARGEALLREPGFAEFRTPWIELRLATGQRDWLGILQALARVQLHSYTLDVVLLAGIAGLAWAFFLAHLGEWPRWSSKIAVLSIVGFGLGVLSTTATLYAVILQDDILGFAPGTEAPRVILYHIAGVGLREELCKLLCFAPLLFFMRRNYDDFTALIVASFVGLGFAIEENGNYFVASAGTSVPGRFLSANFFHIALTGLNGLALFRALRGSAGLNEFLFIFPLTVVLHGLYNAFMSLPQLDEGYLSMCIFIGFSMYYFRRVHELRENARMTISLTGAFVFATSMLAAAMIVFQMTKLGPNAGAQVMFLEIVGSVILLLMFFREFREPLEQ